MENTIQKIICPLCGGRAQKWGQKNSYQLYICSVCKLIFVYPIPNASLIYNEDYFSGATSGFGYVDYDADKEPMIPTFNTYLDLCAQCGKSSGTLFDVGAATGFFLDIAKSRGFDVSGVEMSKFAVEKARQKGLVMFEGDMRSANVKENSQDIVTMFDVIEHMPNPFSEIEEVYRIVKHGGLVVINAPNGQSFLARLLKTSWHLVVPPEHLYYFSPKNLGAYLSMRGFTVVYSRTVAKRFTFSYMFKTLFKWQKFEFWNYLANLFSKGLLAKLYISLNVHDNFFIILKKTKK